jgi:hypothetical protein
MHNVHHFAKKKSKQHGQRNFLETFPKKCLHFKQKNCEIANIFGGFWEISNFFLLEIPI